MVSLQWCDDEISRLNKSSIIITMTFSNTDSTFLKTHGYAVGSKESLPSLPMQVTSRGE